MNPLNGEDCAMRSNALRMGVSQPGSRATLGFRRVLLATAALAGSGCATLVQGRAQGIAVTSEPSGAEVFVGSDLVGVTPASFILARKRSEVVLHIRKEGYVPATVELRKRPSPWLAGDLAYGWFAGSSFGGASSAEAAKAAAVTLGIDLLTGAAYKLNPSKVLLTLTPLPDHRPSKGGPTTGLTAEERTEAQRLAREWVQGAKGPKK